MSNLNQYMAELQASLGHLDTEMRQEIVEEVASHLKDQAYHYQQSGLSEEESMSKAIRYFGRAVDIGHKMREVHLPRRGFGLSAAAAVIFLQGYLMLAFMLLCLGPLGLPGTTCNAELSAWSVLAGAVLIAAYFSGAYGLWQLRWWGFALAISLQLLELAGVINQGTIWWGFGSLARLPPLLVLHLLIA